MRETEFDLKWRVARAMLVPFMRLLFSVKVEGIENLPRTGPAILAFNHISVLDGPCVAIATAWKRRRATRFLIATEIFEMRFSGTVMKFFHQIPLRRGGGDTDALDEAIATIRAGALSAIAPEGYVNPEATAGLQRIRSGIGRIALPTGAVVVPVGIWGTHRRWPRKGLVVGRPWRPRLALVYGEALIPHGDPGSKDDVSAFGARVRESLEEQVRRAQAIAG